MDIKLQKVWSELQSCFILVGLGIIQNPLKSFQVFPLISVALDWKELWLEKH